MSAHIHQTREHEFRDIRTTLARLTERLANLTPSPRQEQFGTMRLQIDVLTREVDQLKTANVQLSTTVKWLQHQNAELERRLSHRKPEVERVVASRAKFQRKLANAYRIIKDLLNEEDFEESSSSSSSRHPEEFSDTLETIPDPNNNTIAPPAAPDGSLTPRQTHHQQLSEETHTVDIGDENEEEQSPNSDPVDDNISLADSRTSSASSSSQTDDPNVASIHYTKPPGSSVGLCSAPLKLHDIALFLEMADDKIQEIERLDSRIDFGIRLCIAPLSAGQMATAFIYDPLFLEEQGSTYLIDWAFQKDNRKTKQSILQMRGKTPSFHTFTFPVKLGDWYYVGALTWRVVNKQPYWPTLNAKGRRRITKKLSARCGDTYSREQIESMLDRGQLEEICVQLDKVADIGVSHRFRDQMEHHDQQVQTLGENSNLDGND